MNKLGKKLRNILEKRTVNRGLFIKNETDANKLGGMVLFTSGVFLLIIYDLTLLGIFPLDLDTIRIPALQGLIEIGIILVFSYFIKKDTWWLKYLLLGGMVLVYARLDVMLTHKAAILMIIPVLFSSRYFSGELTIYTAILSAISFLISAYFGATKGMIDLNIVTMPEGVQFVSTGGFLGDAVKNIGLSAEMLRKNTILYNYLPKLFMFLIASNISYNIATTGRKMVVEQHEKDKKTESIKTELRLANKIQCGTLPNIDASFTDRCEFDLYASMDPAREVGGDFYDFYFVDDDHLALIMADVAGKGIPAALFMMVSKLLIKNEIMNGTSPSDALRRVNDRICRRNAGEMFVTVWIGIIDLKTGKVTAANGGHENPIIKRPDGEFEVFTNLKYNKYVCILMERSVWNRETKPNQRNRRRQR